MEDRNTRSKATLIGAAFVVFAMVTPYIVFAAPPKDACSLLTPLYIRKGTLESLAADILETATGTEKQAEQLAVAVAARI